MSHKIVGIARKEFEAVCKAVLAELEQPIKGQMDMETARKTIALIEERLLKNPYPARRNEYAKHIDSMKKNLDVFEVQQKALLEGRAGAKEDNGEIRESA